MSARRERSKCDACRFLEAGVLAFYDHGGNKYFGQAKITRTSDQQSPRTTRASTSTTGSIGTRSKSRPKTIWKAIARGASSITQQLVKNLFFGTGRSILRKGPEFTLVPVAELVLGKRRSLEIYLNVVEWSPGIYGAESACHCNDGNRCRERRSGIAARLAAILPAPLKRRPERMNNYSVLILERMRQMGLVIATNLLPKPRV